MYIYIYTYLYMYIHIHVKITLRNIPGKKATGTGPGGFCWQVFPLQVEDMLKVLRLQVGSAHNNLFFFPKLKSMEICILSASAEVGTLHQQCLCRAHCIAKTTHTGCDRIQMNTVFQCTSGAVGWHSIDSTVALPILNPDKPRQAKHCLSG